MTMEELFKDAALQAELEQAAEALVRDGMSPAEARQKVLKDRGIEFDEDAANAAAVGRMKLSDEALGNVAGGDDWCAFSHSCFTAFLHDRSEECQACWSDYFCVEVYQLHCKSIGQV